MWLVSSYKSYFRFFPNFSNLPCIHVHVTIVIKFFSQLKTDENNEFLVKSFLTQIKEVVSPENPARDSYNHLLGILADLFIAGEVSFKVYLITTVA